MTSIKETCTEPETEIKTETVENINETETEIKTETVENINETEIKTETVENISKKCNRSFKVKLENDGPQYGRYNGDSPYQAANKALSEIIRTRVKNNQPIDNDITFYLVESTKGSCKKCHQYTGKRIKLDNPVSYTVRSGDKQQIITKEFKNLLRKIKKNNIPDVLTSTNIPRVLTEVKTETVS